MKSGGFRGVYSGLGTAVLGSAPTGIYKKTFWNKSFLNKKHLFYSGPIFLYLWEYKTTTEQQWHFYCMATSYSYVWCCRWRNRECYFVTFDLLKFNGYLTFLIGGMHHSCTRRSNQTKTTSWIPFLELIHISVNLERRRNRRVIPGLSNNSSSWNSLFVYPISPLGRYEVFLVR